MNKTVITVTSIITFGFLLISHWLIQSRERVVQIQSEMQSKTITQNKTETETRDRFTVCVQTVMSEARQSGKPVSANEAKDICVHTKAEKQDKED